MALRIAVLAVNLLKAQVTLIFNPIFGKTVHFDYLL